jgi:uncharacterized protein (TIGR03435 family)
MDDDYELELARFEASFFRDQARLMLRQLLPDRFKLGLHHEMPDISIDALVIARRDGSSVHNSVRRMPSIARGHDAQRHRRF